MKVSIQDPGDTNRMRPSLEGRLRTLAAVSEEVARLESNTYLTSLLYEAADEVGRLRDAIRQHRDDQLEASKTDTLAPANEADIALWSHLSESGSDE